MEIPDRVERFFRVVIELEPGFERAWANLSLVCKMKGKTEEAKAILREGLAANPDDVILTRLLSAGRAEEN